ncbi:glycosyltransferase [Flavobacterium sp. LC2016-23]|uniref:glycosyltransferase family 2 protein n=1 Tax=Flavobacterium sp. LC2016-23 TaxID=2666330 RepID=UPI0012AFDA2E|nr:glycosyltransferase [Flavobacterium sp. LC2016-23]MRX40075.1 glycosyltransferase [Flavobacterium sp. LC2016-23]
MLSILIPTYNYTIYPLVLELHKQCAGLGIAFEIIAMDDASTIAAAENEKINTLEYCYYEILSNNIGRSKIRNLLAGRANYNWLLFLDADVFPKNKDFISNYINHLDNDVKLVNGGLVYPDEKPEKSKLFRWLYGKNREALDYRIRQKNPYLSSLSLNFIIHKSIFEKVSFNETIPNLRHEDTLFSYSLKKENIQIKHINNPVYHYGMDDFEVAIRKENESLHALKHLIDTQLLPPDYVRLSRLLLKIHKIHLLSAVAFFHKITASLFLKNLGGNRPFLFIFDLYRLCYLCQLEKEQKGYISTR